MAWQNVRYQLISSAPALMHSGQTADPLNKWAKALKQLTGKKSKTDADHEEIARIEFLAALYMGADGPVWPSYLVEAALVRGAVKTKEGLLAKSGVLCLEHASLEYDGPRTPDALWADERFRYSSIVRVNMARTPRMRPIFNEWRAVVSLNIETSVVNPSRIDDWFYVTGTTVGFGDWRPRFGRFTATRLNGK